MEALAARRVLALAASLALAAGLGACATDAGGSARTPTPVPSLSSPSASVAALPSPDPSLSTPLPDGQWAVLTDPDSGASMLMPRPLEPKAVDSGGAAGTAYAGDGVNLQVLRLPPGRHADLDASVAITLRSLGGSLISSTTVVVDGHEGREIYVAGPDGIGFVYVRMVATPTHLVSASAGGRDATEAAGQRERAFPTLRVP